MLFWHGAINLDEHLRRGRKMLQLQKKKAHATMREELEDLKGLLAGHGTMHQTVMGGDM